MRAAAKVASLVTAATAAAVTRAATAAAALVQSPSDVFARLMTAPAHGQQGHLPMSVQQTVCKAAASLNTSNLH